MIEVTGDLWEYSADVRVITTNGDVNRFGRAVMSRGVALQAKQRYRDLDVVLAQDLEQHGLRVAVLPFDVVPPIVVFPVKYHWHQKANLKLIARSARELVKLIESHTTVVMPRPGCGNGGLNWEDVKPVIAPILKSRRFVIIERG